MNKTYRTSITNLKMNKEQFRIIDSMSYRAKALYNTSLPPRDGKLILEHLDEFTTLLQDGVGYVGWDNEERLDYLLRLVDAFRVIPSFAFSDEKHITIRELLAWWMWPNNNAQKKRQRKIYH